MTEELVACASLALIRIGSQGRIPQVLCKRRLPGPLIIGTKKKSTPISNLGRMLSQQETTHFQEARKLELCGNLNFNDASIFHP